MSTRQLRKRVEKIEDLVQPTSDGSITLEELYWSIWLRNKQFVLDQAYGDNPSVRVLIPGFERAQKIMKETRQEQLAETQRRTMWKE
jgi:hypothetical protein